METTLVLPRPTEGGLQQPFWDAAKRGALAIQRCGQCGHAFLLARENCPNCLAPDPGWEDASGRATLISWVVYYRAFHPAFAARLPYAVAIVRLEEGPQMITNIVGAEDLEALTIDQPLRLRIDDEDGVAVPRFVPVSSAAIS